MRALFRYVEACLPTVCLFYGYTPLLLTAPTPPDTLPQGHPERLDDLLLTATERLLWSQLTLEPPVRVRATGRKRLGRLWW